MKAPRRNFVVEYKSGRRQSKTQPTSIWGNLDLRAVARQVDADDVLPKTPTTEGHNRSSPPDVTQMEAKVLDGQVDDANGYGAVLPTASAAADTASVVEAVVEDSSFDVIVTAVAASAPVVRRVGVRSRKAPNGPRRVSTLPLANQRSGAEDELTALESENRRLKLLMVGKLRAENEQLESMLSRFKTD